MNERETAAGLAETPGYRYVDAVGDRLFVAGQVPRRGDGELVGPDDPAAQATACLDNLRALIELHRFSIGDVRHLTVHVVGRHQNLLDAWGAVTAWFDRLDRSERLEDGVPPATLLGAHLLGYERQLVEIDATIVRAPTG